MTKKQNGLSLAGAFGRLLALCRRALPPLGGKSPRGMRQRAVRLAAREILARAQRP